MRSKKAILLRALILWPALGAIAFLALWLNRERLADDLLSKPRTSPFGPWSPTPVWEAPSLLERTIDFGEWGDEAPGLWFQLLSWEPLSPSGGTARTAPAVGEVVVRSGCSPRSARRVA
jgi:hypothetical protein